MYGDIHRQSNQIAHEKTWIWLRKGYLKRETESLRIAVQNNAIRTNYIKAKIDYTQQMRKDKLSGEKYETVDHIISGSTN